MFGGEREFGMLESMTGKMLEGGARRINAPNKGTFPVRSLEYRKGMGPVKAQFRSHMTTPLAPSFQVALALTETPCWPPGVVIGSL